MCTHFCRGAQVLGESLMDFQIGSASKISSYLSLGAVVKQIRKTTNGVKIHYEKNGVLSEIVADYCRLFQGGGNSKDGAFLKYSKTSP